MQILKDKPKVPSQNELTEMGYERKAMVRWYNPVFLIRVGLRVIFSLIVGSFTDRREVQAGYSGREIFSYDDRDPIWFDYIADLGDGWNSTYTVAKVLAEPTLGWESGKQKIETRRGAILILGGDEVYPLANRENYRTRTRFPYHSALPWSEEEERPHLYAIPGNHDWYDGLTSFLRQFCQRRSFGAWKTQQDRSYFALQLPKGWWFLAVDIQFENDIDHPQLKYFDSVIETMKPDDQVILATASPLWLLHELDEKNTRKRQNNINFLEKRIGRKAKTVLHIAGDLHHYAHYQNSDEKHRLIAGGGGAFLHGTHALPDKLQIVEQQEEKEELEFEQQKLYPDRTTSRKKLLNNWRFAWDNSGFAMLLGLVYVLMCWVIRSAAINQGEDFWQDLVNSPWSALGGYYLGIVLNSPATATLFTVLVVACILFCDPIRRNMWSLPKKLVLGGLHGLLHIGLMLVLFTALVKVSHQVVDLQIAGLLPVLMFVLIGFALAALLAGTLFGIYLIVAPIGFKCNINVAYASLRIAEYKNLIRFHIDQDGDLQVYAIGIHRIETKWRLNDSDEDGVTWFVPENGKSMADYVHLIEKFTIVAKQRSQQESPEAGRSAA